MKPSISGLGLPLAARWQEHTIPFDFTLTERARLTHPTVVWWWGGRAINDTFGAWCYLCERHVVTWHRAYPITQQARASILAHRAGHLAGTIPTPGGHVVGVVPAAATVTNGGNGE